MLSSGALSFPPLLPPMLPLSNDTLSNIVSALPHLQSPFSLLDPSLYDTVSAFSSFPVFNALLLFVVGILLFLFLRPLFRRAGQSTPAPVPAAPPSCSHHSHETSVGPATLHPLNTATNPFYATSFPGFAPVGPHHYEALQLSPIPPPRQLRPVDSSTLSRPLPRLPSVYPSLPHRSSPTPSATSG